jgi:hypothetical protein
MLIEKCDTWREASILMEKMEQSEFVFLLEPWNRLLDQLYKTGKVLQDPQAGLSTCA